MEQNMKKAGMLISIYMGITMSLCLSLLGNITGGHFSPVLFLITFVVSAVISLVIGVLVPMRKVSQAATKNMKPHSFPARCMESLISDLIYTPVITLAMVSLVRAMLPAQAKATLPPFAIMFLSSLLMCLVAGFVLIFIFMPVFMKLAFRQCGIPFPPKGPQSKPE